MSLEIAETPIVRSRWGQSIAESFASHALLYVLAFASVGVAYIVSQKTGHQMDVGVLRSFGFLMTRGMSIFIFVALITYVLKLAIVDRCPTPIAELKRRAIGILSDKNYLLTVFHGVVVVSIFMSAFGVLKGAIAILYPFSWDQTFRDWDRFLHFGYLPHEWLSFVTASPIAVFVINILYNLWLFVLLVTTLWVCFDGKDKTLRHQYLLSWMLAWLVGGFFVATAFSSAGPCFYGRLGLGNDYDELMVQLHAANDLYPIWALKVQDLLWLGYQNPDEGSMGISAFPSLHVAVSMLMALFAQRKGLWVGALFWAFAGSILVGSVALGWHYAVDGYASIAIILVIWFMSGYISKRLLGT